MNRCLKPGGVQIHAIDVSTEFKKVIFSSIVDVAPFIRWIKMKYQSEIRSWIKILIKSGIKIRTRINNPLLLLDRKVLVETPDIVYRFYPPNNTPKAYQPTASLLLIINKE